MAIKGDEDSGIHFMLDKSQFLPLFAQALPEINAFLKNQTLEYNVQYSILNLTKFVLSADDIKEDQFTTDIDMDLGTIMVHVRDLKARLLSYVTVDAYLFTSNGTILVEGTVSEIIFSLSFDNFTDTKKGKPYFDFCIRDLHFDKDSVVITADIDYIPNFLLNLIIKLVQDSMLDDMRDRIVNVVNQGGFEVFDRIIDEYYPNEVALTGYDAAVSVVLSKEAFVTPNYFNLIALGDFAGKKGKFLTPVGQTKMVPRIAGDAYGMYLHVSMASVKSYLNTFFNFKISDQGTFYSYSVESINNDDNITINQSCLTLTNYKMNFSMTMINGDYVNAHILLQLQSKLLIEFDSAHNYFITVDMSGVGVSSISFDSSISNISYFSGLASAVLQTYLRETQVLRFPLPHAELPFNAKATEMHVDVDSTKIILGYCLDYK
jgi:hypothetical protein